MLRIRRFFTLYRLTTAQVATLTDAILKAAGTSFPEISKAAGALQDRGKEVQSYSKKRVGKVNADPRVGEKRARLVTILSDLAAEIRKESESRRSEVRELAATAVAEVVVPMGDVRDLDGDEIGETTAAVLRVLLPDPASEDPDDFADLRAKQSRIAHRLLDAQEALHELRPALDLDPTLPYRLPEDLDELTEQACVLFAGCAWTSRESAELRESLVGPFLGYQQKKAAALRTKAPNPTHKARKEKKQVVPGQA